MAKTSDRQIVNGVTYEIMDTFARESVAAEATAREAAVAAEASERETQITDLKSTLKDNEVGGECSLELHTGYLDSDSGAIYNQGSGTNRYFTKPVLGGECYLFTGGYTNLSGLLFAFTADGTVYRLVVGTSTDKFVVVPDDAVEIRGWSDISISQIKLERVNSFRRLDRMMELLIPDPKIGYLSTSGEIINEGAGTNRYIIVQNLQGGESFSYTGGYAAQGWGLAFSVDSEGTVTQLFAGAKEDYYFTVPADCVELRVWSDISYKTLELRCISDITGQLTEINKVIDSIKGFTEEPLYGYLNTDGSIGHNSDTRNRYYQIQGLSGGESFIYTGSYNDSYNSSWGLAFSVDGDGVCTQLFAGKKDKYLFTVPDDCVELRVWSNTGLDLQWADTIRGIIEELEAQETIPRFIVVDAKGDGSFTSIQDAIDYAKRSFDVNNDSITIFIKNGVYPVSPTNSGLFYAIDKGPNRISLIGESRDGVIIRCTCTSELQGIALNIGGDCVVENMTIENLADDSFTPETLLPGNHRPYCIHNDEDAADESKPYYTTVRNVKCYSECDTPIGAGLHHNQVQRYENCELIYAANAVRTQQGALYVHAPHTASYVAKGLEVVNCVLVSNNEMPALSVPNVSGTQPWSEIPQTYIRNVTYSAGQNEVALNTTSSITPQSKGNTNSALNK